jgi:transposase InsO family protein
MLPQLILGHELKPAHPDHALDVRALVLGVALALAHTEVDRGPSAHVAERITPFWRGSPPALSWWTLLDKSLTATFRSQGGSGPGPRQRDPGRRRRPSANSSPPSRPPPRPPSSTSSPAAAAPPQARASATWEELCRPNFRSEILIDDCARFVTGHGVDDAERAEMVISTFEEAIARHGKPEYVMNDGGSAFWAWRGISRFTSLLTELGIDQIHAKKKEHNGKVEVFNANLHKELFDRHRFYDLAEMKRRLAAHLHWYNHARTHHALGGLLVPADRYYGRAAEVMARIESGGHRDGDELELRDRCLELFKVVSKSRPSPPPISLRVVPPPLASTRVARGPGLRPVAIATDGPVAEASLPQVFAPLPLLPLLVRRGNGAEASVRALVAVHVGVEPVRQLPVAHLDLARRGRRRQAEQLEQTRARHGTIVSHEGCERQRQAAA